jgi:alcohol dehydrogenase class IV
MVSYGNKISEFLIQYLQVVYSALAGLAFTRAYVGNVHAIAHTLGRFYSIPHGLANAVILPYVLEYYGESAHKASAVKLHFCMKKIIPYPHSIKLL